MAVLGRLQAVELNVRMLIGQGAEVVVVASSGNDYRHLKKLNINGLHLHKHPNQPLGRKWQYGVQKAIEIGANPLIIVGSDDFLSEKFIEKACELTDEFDFIFFNRWMIYEPGTGKSYSLKYKIFFPLGSGRVYSEKFLQRHPRLFDTRLSIRLDDFAFNNLRADDTLLLNPDDMHLLAVKGDWETMNPLDKILSAPTIEWTEELGIDKYFNFSTPIKQLF